MASKEDELSEMLKTEQRNELSSEEEDESRSNLPLN